MDTERTTRISKEVTDRVILAIILGVMLGYLWKTVEML